MRPRRYRCGTVALLVLLVLLGILVVMVVTTYKLARLLGAGLPILWAIAMFIPCLNLLMLLVLSSKAQAGTSGTESRSASLARQRESIEEVRRRMLSSTFD